MIFQSAIRNLKSAIPHRGYLFVASAAFLWGTLGLFFRILHDQFGFSALAVAFLRASSSAVVLVLVLMLTRRELLRIPLRAIAFFIAFGFCGITAFYFFYTQAVIETSVTTAVVLLYTAPAFVSVIAWRAWNEPMTSRKIIALILAFVGCALIARAYDLASLRFNAVGLAFGLGAGFTYALYTVFSKFALAQHSSLTAVTYALLFGTLFLALFQSLNDFQPLIRNPVAWIFLLALVLGPTLGAYVLYNLGLRRVPASNASLIATLEPVVASVLAFLFLGERMELAQVFGGLMIIGGAVWLGIGNEVDLQSQQIQEQDRSQNNHGEFKVDDSAQTIP